MRSLFNSLVVGVMSNVKNIICLYILTKGKNNCYVYVTHINAVPKNLFMIK